MSNRQDENSGDEPSRDGAENSPAAGKLPVVWSPRLDGDDAEAVTPSDIEATDEMPACERMAADDADVDASEPPSEPMSEPFAAAQPRSPRFALLAAAIVALAACGAFAGSLAASGVIRLFPADAPVPRTADAHDMLRAFKAQLAEISALKASLDGTSRAASAQFAKLSDRVDSLARAQAEPSARLAHIADIVDRIAKRDATAPETTGSIATSASQVATAAPVAAPSAPTAAPAPSDHVIDGWIVEDVRNGRALVESRYGGEFLVVSGSVIPGLGRVEVVRRQNGEWVVVTARGTITASGR